MNWIIRINQPSGRSTYWTDLGVTSERKKAKRFDGQPDALLTVEMLYKKYGISRKNINLIPTKKAANKYGAKAVWVYPNNSTLYEYPEGEAPEGAERFDSKLEANTFLLLSKYFPRNEIIRQYPLLVKPKTALYEELYWKVDFAIKSRKFPTLYVESKGVALPEFKRNLQYFQLFGKDEWSCLTVVGATREKIDKVVKQITLEELDIQIQQMFTAIARKGN